MLCRSGVGAWSHKKPISLSHENPSLALFIAIFYTYMKGLQGLPSRRIEASGHTCAFLQRDPRPTLLWIGQARDSTWQSNGESHLKGYRYSGHDWKGALGPPALGYL